MSIHLPTNTTIQLTEQLIKQLTDEQQVFNQQSIKSLKQFDTSNDIEYYVLSAKFLKQWKNMVQEALQHSAPTEDKKFITTPQSMNEQLIQTYLKDFNEIQLKKQIREGIDFMFYNYSTMRIFQRYTGVQIPRRAYYSGVEKKVQMYPIKFQFVYMSQSWLELAKKNQNIQLPVLTSNGYKNQTILDLLYRLVQFSKKDSRNRQSIYQNNGAAKAYFCLAFDPKQYVKKLRSQQQPSKQFLQRPGDQIKGNKIIGDLEIPTSNYMLVIQLQEDKWVYKSMDLQSQRCEYCRQTKKLKIQCRCKNVKYCSEECKQKDWKYHVRTCQAQYEQDNLTPTFTVKQNSRLGIVGLANLGNTCYMNAALQCMIHTKGLTQYFTSMKYQKQINQTNPIGSHGKLIKSYAKFIESVITTQQQVVTPSRLKYAIGKTKQMFSGYQQHDSQQFLLFMLDTLHEDLNRVIKKPLTSGVQNQGRPDYEVAKQSWITYLKRNQSIINDLMGGQYRSQVKCPDCNNISVTFDPYLIFAVPIPTSQARSINLYYFFSNYNNETLKMTLTSKNNTVLQLRQGVANKSKSELNQILLFVSGFNGSVRKVEQTETVDKLTNQKQLNQNSQEKQLFAMQFQHEELQNLENKKFLVFKFVTKLGRTLTFKRPFPMEWRKLKGSDIYRRACQFLLSIWSKSQRLQEGKQRQIKLQVFNTKVLQQKLFKILLAYGKPTEVKNRLIYNNKLQIDQNTNITQLLQKYNFQTEFQVQFAEDPFYLFNSYKSYVQPSSATNHYDYSQGPKIGNDQVYTLDQCLTQMKKSQKLIEGNQVFCSVCQNLKLAQKKMQLYKASKYLILQLRRFKQIGYQKMKNYAQIKFPQILDLSNHIISPSIPQTYFIENQQQFIKPNYWTGYNKSIETNYKLYGVVNHHGSLNAGHYTAFGNFKDKWYKFDDRNVDEVKPQEIVTSAAYLLFYERI